MDNKNGFYDRINPRWKGYDYTKFGAYFITFCTHGRKKILSEVEFSEKDGVDFDAVLTLTDLGRILEERLKRLETSFPGLKLGEYAIMPNHVHFILFRFDGDQKVNISRIVGSVKSYVSKRYGLQPGEKLFQRSFFDRVIRSEQELAEITRYIIDNPKQWALDKYNN